MRWEMDPTEEIPSYIKNPTLWGGMGVATLLLGCVPVIRLLLGRYGYLASLPCRLLRCFFLPRGLFLSGPSDRLGFCRDGGRCRCCHCWLLATRTTYDLFRLEDFERVACQIFQHPISVCRLTPRDQTFWGPGVCGIAGVDSALPVRV